MCSYTGHKSGTSNLIKHKCETGQKNITSFISVKAEVKKPEVSLNLKSLATLQLVKFVFKEIMPFEIASGNGFVEMAQFLIDVGTKYGAENAKELLHHPTTISRNLNKNATVLQDSVSKEDRDVFSGVSGAITLDLWSDVYRKINYLGVIAHYIANGKLEDSVLCTREFNSDMKKLETILKLRS
jgi:hypothetical protein